MSELKFKFHKVLLGLEHLSFTEKQIEAYLYEFEDALHDYNSCSNCDGKTCKTVMNRYATRILKTGEKRSDDSDITKTVYGYRGDQRVYFALYKPDCEQLNRPAFRLHYCPGQEVRQAQIVQGITSLRGGAA